jgi:hypothetical protein
MSPWTQAVQVLEAAFTGPIATGLALVAIVVGGLMFAFGEGGAKRTMAGVIFGVGMAVSIQVGTPSPAPRQLMKTLSRGTLSPKGERAGFSHRR